ncbi:hypothetical protein TPHA_0E03530 [Tetrapisispora phaffii CBS 4417]|uniref:Cell division control protein n=1 Tax=Tetrapisispora phaffii (strain ATCC 24235 / CBS 4417 / NBRC 1672 / NRRL Y-8282 / UCD 70-5) TaxID=1071381 RepID=G8BU65_TETPH|nr:hypothetical protein TPHA_0E03530 [Tetrapisispora phaffii CBS 4417]CCE63443.1 hypothetical protein TPHA_0E03530 [Tetrapisispora phaffii CBS 4417]
MITTAGGRVLRGRKRPTVHYGSDDESSDLEVVEEVAVPTTPKKSPLKKRLKRNNTNELRTPPRSVSKKSKNVFMDPNNIFITPVKMKLPVNESKPSLMVTPRASPQKLVFGKNNLYSRTKALLQRSSGMLTQADGSLPTREKEYAQLREFLDENISAGKSNSLYITGPPGTGKTAQIESILRDNFHKIVLPQLNVMGERPVAPEINEDLENLSYYTLPNGDIKAVATISINCIALANPSVIFNRIYNSFVKKHPNDKKEVRTSLDLQTFFEKYSSEVTFMVVLDEMDKLVNSAISNDVTSTKIIFELFLLAKLPKTNFLLLGIANSLDMQDRFLTRLTSEQDLLPKTILFHPYTADEMYQIIMNRLKTLKNDLQEQEEYCVFNEMAIKFAAKKCSGNTGDLRKLFDILRSSVEILELEMIAAAKSESPFLKSHTNNTTVGGNTLKKVGLPHIAKVFTSSMNNSSTKSKISKLNMQQKILLCTLMHREKSDIFQTHCTLDDAYDYYTKMLKAKNSLAPLKRNEFLESCNALETCGVVNIFEFKKHGKTKYFGKMVKTSVDIEEFETEITKVDLLKSFLN